LNIRRTLVGTSRGHAHQAPSPVEAYTLDTGTGFAISVWTFGATLVEVWVPDRSGRIDNVVRRLPDLESYEERSQNPYVGSTVGRYSRCIAGGVLRLDGAAYPLACNYGKDHFHGGPLGFDRFVWRAEAAQHATELELRLYLDSPDGDQGYPGALATEASYRLTNSGRLSFEYTATTSKSTVVALTNHAYWNLAGAGQINDHQLTLRSPHVLMVDEALIPSGGPVSVLGTVFDYTEPRLLGDAKLDHCYVWADASRSARAVTPSPARPCLEVAELYHAASGRLMRVSTDQPGLQMYSGEVLAEPRGGLCFEAGAWPNCPNRPDYPSSRLDPGGVYRQTTVHEFSCR
jgi:aldose 1-epimerase